MTGGEYCPDVYTADNGLLFLAPEGVGVNKTQNAPPGAAWGVIQKLGAGVTRMLFALDSGARAWLNAYDGTKWIGWSKIATATPPQMYNLPLASQIPSGQSYTNIYYKTQDNIVHVSFCISRNDKFQKGEVFATLPVGYRPGHTIARCVAADGIDFGNGIVVAEIQIYSNGNIMMYHCNSDVKWLLGEFSFIAEN